MRSRFMVVAAVFGLGSAAACNSLRAAPISACADDEPGAALECTCEQNPHDARCTEGGTPEADATDDANDATSDGADAPTDATTPDATDASTTSDADAPGDAADSAD